MRVRLRGHHPLRPGIQPGSPHTRFSPTGGRRVGTGTAAPTTPMPQPPTGITRHRFSHHPLSLATTHGVSFPAGTEMFHFPAYPPQHKPCGAGPQQPAGYPIRTPSDQSPVGGSPRPIAAPHVLHRYCLPRHPPYAHGNKPTNPRKKGGPTGPCHLHWNTLRQLIRSSKHHPHHTVRAALPKHSRTQSTHPPEGGHANGSTKSTVRTHPAHPARAHRSCSRPLSSSQTTTPHHPRHPPHTRGTAGTAGTEHHPPQGGLAVREPNSMHHTTTHPHHKGAGALTLFQPAGTPPGQTARNGSIPTSAHDRAPTKLRRKEVIQPHLPVRLPCYDLVPITSLTLDGSPHKG